VKEGIKSTEKQQEVAIVTISSSQSTLPEMGTKLSCTEIG
jgi:hypothetical protein